MFGRMTVMPIVQVAADPELQVAITTVLQEADQPEITTGHSAEIAIQPESERRLLRDTARVS